MTAHNEAKKEEIAPIVIMPGDPLRAKWIAETYLENYTLVNQIRGMLAYTGFYKGKRITVMGSGMGMPSMGIYAYELYHFYEVETIIRVGSCGSFDPNMQLMDLIIADSVYTESNFAYEFNESTSHKENATKEIVEALEITAKSLNIPYCKGTMLSTDVFDHYTDWQQIHKRIAKQESVIGAEMEAFALFFLANLLGKKAACIATVVDTYVDVREASAEERQGALSQMVELALNTTLSL